MNEEKTDEKTIPRVLRCEIVGPSNGTWAELGPELHAYRAAATQCVNGALFAVHKASTEGLPDGKLWTAAYQEIPAIEAGFRAWAAGLEEKTTTQARMAALEFGGATKSLLAQVAYEFFRKWRRERGKIHSAGRGFPVPVRADKVKVSQDATGHVLLEMRIAAGTSSRTCVRLATSYGWHRETLLKIAAKEFAHGSVNIVYDERAKRPDGAKGKWYAIVSYKQPKPQLPAGCDPNKLLVLHRGQHNFLTAITSTGRGPWFLHGSKLKVAKERFQAARRSRGRASTVELGSGAKGHGRTRRLASSTHLSDKESRFIDTFCQQAAAWAIKLAKQEGCGTLVIGEYGGIGPNKDDEKRRFLLRFPYYRLKKAVASAAAGAGMELQEVSEVHVSSECPRCGNLDMNQAKDTEVFVCSLCTFSRKTDHVSTILMLRRVKPANNGWDDRLRKEKQQVARMRT